MGSRIAAHLANVGIPVVLLDMVPPGAPAEDPMARNRIVSAALDALTKAKPAAAFDLSVVSLITIGNFEDHLGLLRDCDWVIEAVAEDLEIKQSLLQKVAPFCRPDAIVTTNTSGLPVASIAANMLPEFRSRWFGTHFFNPPRYMRLLEIIPTPETDPALIDCIAEFADKRLGKTVVRAKDTPNFIANRIGTFAMLNTVRLMEQQDLSVEDVDALTGSAIGWPKTG
ncbi:MAG TPA: 3-hydroxyacyl-CoA dehydrogenase family protein, partial [Acidobacteriaceae bacterium]|nr:3-hydroxyacyl-CoA dehydrogenase family protein [Acidobacteriaceae bacterium]